MQIFEKEKFEGKRLMTENGLNAKIDFFAKEGIAGWIEIAPDHWKDCKWDIYGKCLLPSVFGSFCNLVYPEQKETL